MKRLSEYGYLRKAKKKPYEIIDDGTDAIVNFKNAFKGKFYGWKVNGVLQLQNRQRRFTLFIGCESGPERAQQLFDIFNGCICKITQVQVIIAQWIMFS